MKITKVEAIPLSSPQTLPSGTVIVKVYTDEEIVGVGQPSSAGSPLAISAIVNWLSRFVIEEDPFNVERIWQKLYDQAVWFGHAGGVIRAISGIEMALWDIIGKALKVPCYKLFGGFFREKVKVYASDTAFRKSPKEAAKDAVRWVEAGFECIKHHISGDVKRDLEMVKLVRDSIGDDIDFIVDLSKKFDPTTAIRVAKKMEKYDIFMFEEPVPPDDVDALVKVRSALDTPIATGETVYTRYGFKEILVKGAADIIQPDCTVVGGMMEWKKVCAMADAWRVPVIPHAWGTQLTTIAHLHLAVSTPNFVMLEYPYEMHLEHPFMRELLTEPIKFKNGFIEVPKKPGLGISLNEEALSKYLCKNESELKYQSRSPSMYK